MSPTLPSAAFLASDKIQPRHRQRQAVVYVRQSTLRQVQQHGESTRLQYALADHAQALGWQPGQIVVIDDDLGRSAASALDRPGFQRLVAEVGLGHVGLILGIEVSRLARSCRDWHQLLEICALFDTLIADADGLYGPSGYNDRLLLGLKGTMSEAELHILKGRMLEGRRAKAARGELVMGLPRGYVQRPSGEVALDPDEGVRSVIRLVFDVFERRRSVRGVLTYLVDHDIGLPDRLRSGPCKGEVRWNRPNQATVADMLRHPAYAGAYVYGRRRMERRAMLPGRPHSGRRFIRAPEGWAVLRRDCWPAYIDWETYTRNQEQMRANRAKHEGVPQGGHALLGGLVHCGRCGRRMTLGYHNNGREARYSCCQEAVTFAGPRCQSVSAAPVDHAVGQLILAALTPSAVEVSLQLAEDVELERAARRQHWAERLERARYETALARRRYEAVDPDLRLVARTLERDWEGALAAEEALQAEQARELAREPPRLEAAELAVIRQLAEDIPALWRAATTTQQDRQAIARLVLERAVIRLEGASEHLEVECEWAGGVRTRHAVVRSVRRFEQLRGFDQILATIRDLRRQGCSAAVIADRLNAAGWHPPKRAAFEAGMIQRLMFRHGMTGRRPIWSGTVPRQPDAEWTLHEAAERLGIHRHTAYHWLRVGRLRGQLAAHGGQRIWLVTMTGAELAQLRAAMPSPDRTKNPA
ncbi:recombinase family protein [Belnapia rosea]|uniref:Site-specific DNA recombinase n=2 Tax=Belnapia rosea TaxID=938405 RepID=A0A1G7E7T2_9PROT|nr:recombinase family protein [Belnapia rosea]SDE59731.1 Site-specific DNA recombinase [Belnapia rosea]